MKKSKIPTEPTLEQKAIVNNRFHMDEVWFGNIFKKDSSFVESPFIYGEYEGSEEDRKYVWRHAQVYAQNAFIHEGTDKQEKAIYCFFIYFENGVYQANSTEMVAALIEALKVDRAWEEYENKIADAKYEKNQKLKKQQAAKKVKPMINRKKAA